MGGGGSRGSEGQALCPPPQAGAPSPPSALNFRCFLEMPHSLKAKISLPGRPSGRERSPAFCATDSPCPVPPEIWGEGKGEGGRGPTSLQKKEGPAGGLGARATERSLPLPGPPDLPLTLPPRSSRYQPPGGIKGNWKCKQKNTPFSPTNKKLPCFVKLTAPPEVLT